MGYTCKHCGANNDQAGTCVMCLKQMGSLKKAINAGFFSSGLLCAIWVLLVVILKIELTFFAIIFGGLVAAAVVKYSGGRGFLYQIVAWFFTIAGIVGANSYGIYFLWNKVPDYYNSGPRPGILDLSYHLLVYDTFTILFYILGVLGASWVWLESDPLE